MSVGADTPADRRGGVGRVVGVGLLAGGMVAVAVAHFLPTGPARPEGLPYGVPVAGMALTLAGIGAVVVTRLGRGDTESMAVVRRRWWAVGLGLGAVLLGRWAVLAGIDDIETGLPGPALPLLAVGCAAVLVAAVLLAITARAPLWHRGSVVRQVLPAAVAVVTVAAVGGVAEVAALRWIPVDATTAEPADPAAVPDPPGGVRWTRTRTWPWQFEVQHGVVAAGAGVIVASGDRIVAIDGPTGAERWYHRWAGAVVLELAATPDGRTAVARVRPGRQSRGRDLQSALFAFDASTGEVRWSRYPGFDALQMTDHVLIQPPDRATRVGIDLGSGEDIWTWKRPPECASRGESQPSPDALLVSMTCRDPSGDWSNVVIGVDDRTGTQRWRFASPAAANPNVDLISFGTSPDGRAALFALRTESQPVLLESATGAVVHQPDGDTDILAPDLRTPVLSRRVADNEFHTVLVDVSTGSEQRLEHDCSAAVLPVVTARSVLLACVEWVPQLPQRAIIDVRSRSDATRTATITATDAARPVRPSYEASTELITAPGAVVLVVWNRVDQTAVMIGLT